MKNKTRRTHQTLLTATLTLPLLLAGCGSFTPAPSAEVQPTAQKPAATSGVLNLTRTQIGDLDFTTVSASFDATPAETLRAADLADRCFVTGAAQTTQSAAAPTSSVDAGHHLTLTSDGRPYAELTRDNTGGDVQYVTDAETMLASPRGSLALEVPGSKAVPALTVTLPEPPAPVTLTTPTDAVTATSPFTWTAKGSADTLVQLILATTLNGVSRTVACYARDDGAFGLPDETRQKLGGDATLSLRSVGRMTMTSVTNAGVQLHLLIGTQTLRK
ncbi:hypothetical protein [Deinococcus pimensis]|uniref:hypothetical protein n=1 Tax=Deinococcus pimensis TaxID=309888 RepID=UPI00048377C6|nr:hypothetical protein [Deinococcus pimensis]